MTTPCCTMDIVDLIIQQQLHQCGQFSPFSSYKEEYTSRPAVEETINDPTNPKHYLRYRVHVTLEFLLLDDYLKMTVKDIVVDSARSYPGKNREYMQDNEKHVVCSEKKLVEKVQKEISTVQLNGNSYKGTEFLA